MNLKERVAGGATIVPNTPHCWEIAHVAFQRIFVNDRGNQSILISGESGAGKTETAKILMNYFGALAAAGSVRGPPFAPRKRSSRSKLFKQKGGRAKPGFWSTIQRRGVQRRPRG